MAGPKNWQQKFVTNPITSNQNDDLLYWARSPYGVTNDAVINWQNFSAQFGAPYTASALTRANDTNVTLTLGGTPGTSLLQAVSLTLGWAGQLSLARGGTNANLTASNGGIFYSTGSAGAILAGTATANQILLSGSSAAPAWSTATYPATTTVNQVLYSSSANVIGGISAVNSAVMISSAGGVPSFSTTLPSGLTIPGYQTSLTLPLSLANGGTNAALTASNGGIFYSTASAGAILGGTATAQQLLMSGSSTTPQWSTTTYPLTNAVNTLLYASSANVMGALATVNSAVLSTNASGVPTWLALTDGQLVIGSSVGAPLAATITAGTGITVTNGHNTITIAASGGSNPWSAGAGTASAIGGDGTETAAGNYAVCYGTNSSTAAGISSITFGKGNTNSGNYAFVAGENNFTGASAVAAAIFGNNSACSASYQFAAGNNNNVNGNATGSFCLGQNNTVNGSSVSSAALGDTCVVDAAASHAFALGYSSTAVNSGSWVISDGSGNSNSDTSTNQFVSTFANGHFFYTGTSRPAFQILGTASAVNYVALTNNTTGNPPVFNARGTDTNIDLNLGGKGTGAVNILGASTNSSAASGYVGEYVSSQIVFGSAISLTNNTSANLTSISLTAGDWDVYFNVSFDPTGICTGLNCGISTTSVTLPDASLYTSLAVTVGANSLTSLIAPTVRLSISTTTTVYGVVTAAFSTGATTACGLLSARRRR